MKKLSAVLIVLILTSLVLASKAIPRGATKQHFTVVMRKTGGFVNPGITITTLDLYAIKDGNAISTKIDLTAATCKDRTKGVYEVNIPNSWTDGTWATYHDNITFIVDDGNTANPSQYGFYEIQISPPVDVNTVCGEVPISDTDVEADINDLSIHGDASWGASGEFSADDIVNELLTGHDILFSLSYWIKRAAAGGGVPW